MFKKIYPDKPIIAVDFDGTIVEDKFPKIGKVKKGFKKWYKLAKKNNCILILWTCRETNLLREVKKYLESIGCPFDYYNENNKEFGAIKCRKILATVYIDDRAGFINWDKELKTIKILIKNWQRGIRNV